MIVLGTKSTRARHQSTNVIEGIDESPIEGITTQIDAARIRL